MTTLLAPESDLAEVDLGNLELWREGPPHELFARMREMDGLHWSPLDAFPEESGFWSIVRFEDIATVGRDHSTYSSKRSIVVVDKLAWDGETPDPLDLAENMLITQDPPRHDRLKALVQRAFTPKRALEHTERMREIINLVYDRALAANPDGRLDLVQDVGIYVPSMVIGDMLGVPREDAPKLVDWTNRTSAFEDPRLVPDLGDVWRALEEFVPYVNGMLEEREAEPTADLTTAFIEAEIEGARMSHEEVLMFFFLLMIAGNDSTRAVFTSGMKSLLDDPEQLRLVRSGEVPLEQVVEEFVRYNPAFAYMRRTATRDTELAGQRIAAGEKLALWYVAGNRDESAFEDPQRFDVRRKVNDHQGFGGGGRHFCLGAGLARLELKLWIEETLRRFPDLALDGEPTRVNSTFLNQYRTIPVALL
ncbi:MAG TPA: cytochrome P450 [Solirubrobacteraceae bacterium]|nr:cytochrome P450 [Solirubrobacteraceae bacterium]